MRPYRLLLAALLPVLVCGCSMFQSKERLDLSPFAEYTVTLAADIEYSAANVSTPRLRQYRADPRVLEHREYWSRIRRLLRGVVAYSVEISTLGNSKLDGPARTDRYATFLDRLLREELENAPDYVRFSTADLDTMLANVREQDNLLDALREAQPFVDELARLADLLFDATQDDLLETFSYLDGRIAEENTGPVQAWDGVLDAQARIFESLGLIRAYMEERDPAVLETLFTNEVDLPALANDPDRPTDAELVAMRNTLFERLQLGVEIKDLLLSDLDRYYAQQQELDELYQSATLMLKRARITVIVWSRAHRDLSSGVTDPATIDIFDITKSAVNTVL